MYILMYLPNVTKVLDGQSTRENFMFLNFRTKKEAKFFIRNHYFKTTEHLEGLVFKDFIFASKYDLSNACTVPKHLIEIIKEIPDV